MPRITVRFERELPKQANPAASAGRDARSSATKFPSCQRARQTFYNSFRGWPSHHIETKRARRREGPGIQDGYRRLRSQIESLARTYERPALRKPFAAFPADTKVA